MHTVAQEGVQALLGTLFALPTTSTPDGPLAILPTPTTALPRSKSLPHPKPPTKWERFAAAKGISKTKRERKIWDEEKQDWVNRWGRDGKNREEETQWLTEVKANADVDHNPSKVAREARKARVAKNERQRLQNAARAQSSAAPREDKKSDIERTLSTTRVSTASMGRFDKKLEGEKKMKGVKRKVSTRLVRKASGLTLNTTQFDPSEVSATDERSTSLALLKKMDSDSVKMKRSRTDAPANNDPVNVRKAIRGASKGRGGMALARSSDRQRGGGGPKSRKK